MDGICKKGGEGEIGKAKRRTKKMRKRTKEKQREREREREETNSMLSSATLTHIFYIPPGEEREREREKERHVTYTFRGLCLLQTCFLIISSGDRPRSVPSLSFRLFLFFNPLPPSLSSCTRQEEDAHHHHHTLSLFLTLVWMQLKKGSSPGRRACLASSSFL